MGGRVERSCISRCLQISGVCDCSHEIKRCLLLERKVMTNLDSVLKAETLLCWQRSVYQSYGFSSSHIRMWELDHKEDWALNNWCFWTVVLEKTLESPLDCKEIKPGFLVHHQLLELAQTHVHLVGDAIQPPHPLLSPSPAFNLPQHQVGKVLELQLRHQSFQWIFRTDFL